ncbi:cell division topological specificity factor [Clostridium sp. CAG:389]|nr:cell division topological specificity factor [Clostridium sp. CAG:389]
MFENIINFFKNIGKKEDNKKAQESSKDAAKERLHLVLMQDRANVSADFLELMKQEIIDVIKKYIEVDEKEIDVRLTNKENEDGTNGAPALYANIPILNIKNDARKIGKKEVEEKESSKQESSDNKEEKTKDKEVKKEKTEKSAESKDDNKIENNKEEDEKIKEEKSEEKKENNEEEQKEIEAQEKIKEIIDGVIEEAENNKNEKIKS